MNEWTRRDFQLCNFKNYDLTYAFYSKFPSWGCQAKLRQVAASNDVVLKVKNSKSPKRTMLQTQTKLYRNRAYVFLNFTKGILKEFIENFSTQISSESETNKGNFLVAIQIKNVVFLISYAYFLYSFITFVLITASFNHLISYSSVGCVQDTKSLKSHKKNCNFYLQKYYPSSLFPVVFVFYFLVFSFTDFASPLILFCWWRTKISWL